MKTVTISSISVGGGAPLVLIAGPCVVESRDMIFSTAEKIKGVASRIGMPFVFKSSYKKANLYERKRVYDDRHRRIPEDPGRG